LGRKETATSISLKILIPLFLASCKTFTRDGIPGLFTINPQSKTLSVCPPVST
jgi:hypothetical protein